VAQESIRRIICGLAARRTNGTRVISTFIMISLLLTARHSSGQTGNGATEERETLQQAVSVLSKCVLSKKAACIPRSVSNRGLTVGVDGPRLSKPSLVRQLSSNSKLQCLFWGSHCSPDSKRCTISDSVRGLTSADFGKPRMYDGRWQVDVERSTLVPGCGSAVPFVFQLEGGFWKLLAIPYT
jgi:hypothetical protein